MITMTIESSQTRRIHLSGGSTFIISLPKRWVRDLGINVGDDITMIKNSDQSLTLVPNHSNQVAQTTAVIESNSSESSDSIKRKIISVYLSGYKTIKITTKGIMISPEHTKTIRELVRSAMIGTEIVESSSESIVIQVLARLPELSFEIALKRMYLMAINMIVEAIESMSEVDLIHAEEVVSMDDEVDRFGLYMRRNLVIAVGNELVLKDMGLQKTSDCLGYRAVISRIERIADHAVLVAKRVKFMNDKIKPKQLTKINGLVESSLAVFEEAVTAVQEHDFDKGEHVASKISDIVTEEKSIRDTIQSSDENAMIIRFLLEDLRRIAEYSSDIAEVAIDENIQSVISRE